MSELFTAKDRRKERARLMKISSICYFCDRKVFEYKMPRATLDHLIPKAKGGTDTKANRVLCCSSCNYAKANYSEKEFKREIVSLAKAILEKEKKMETKEQEAYLHGGQNAAEYAKSIGKCDLSQFTGPEWLTFCECLCKNYHDKYTELENNV